MHHNHPKKPERHITHRRLYAIFFYMAILIGVMVSFPIMVTPNAGLADANPDLVPIEPAAQVSAGMDHSVFLDYDGLVYAWGDNAYDQIGSDIGDHAEMAVQLELPEPAIAVSAGAFHTLVVGQSGTVYGFGRNAFGQVGDGTVANVGTPVAIQGLPPIKAVAAGAYHSLALGVDGSVWAWGHNTQHQVGDVTSQEVLGLDGKVIALRNTTPVQIVASGAVAIAAGGNFSLYIDEQGQLFAWGDNSKGQLGDGTTESHGTPALVKGISQVTSVAAGDEHVLALSSASGYRQLYVWGNHALGQLGLGKLSDKNNYVTRPTLLDITGNLDPSDERLLAVHAGYAQSAVVRDVSYARFFKPAAKNQLYVWGLNVNAQLALGNTSSQYTPVLTKGFYDGYFADRFMPFEGIAFGSEHLLVLSSKGLLAAAGANDRGQLGIGSTEDQVKLSAIVTQDLIRPRWLSGQSLKIGWKDKTTLNIKWPQAQDNTAVAGYWAVVTAAGKEPVVVDAGLATNCKVPGLDQATPVQVVVYAYDSASKDVNRDELAHLTGYSLPDNAKAADYFLPASPVTAPVDLVRHNWQPDPSGKRQPAEVPWSTEYIENQQQIIGPYTLLICGVVLPILVIAIIVLALRIRNKKRNSLVEVDPEREVEAG